MDGYICFKFGMPHCTHDPLIIFQNPVEDHCISHNRHISDKLDIVIYPVTYPIREMQS